MSLLYITLLLAVQFSLPNADETEETNRIHKGKIALPNTVPFQAAVIIFNNNNKTFNLCSGSLITTTFVLTAANCLFENVKSITVLFGTHNLKAPEPNTVEMNTTTFKIHEKYNPETFEHDIAVIKLPNPVVLNEFISIIKLPKKSNDKTLYIDKVGQIAGWGALDPYTQYSVRLKELRVEIVDITKCLELEFPVSKSNLCGVGAFDGSPCLGDSGAPLVLEDTDTQIGVFTTVTGNCNLGLPTLYVNVATHLNWIEKNSNYIISK